MKVFLGGTCNGSKWRDELIEKLDKCGIEYFNPIVNVWDEHAKAREIQERKECDFVLYTITPEMKGLYSIAELIDDSNKRMPKTTIVCFLPHYNDKHFDPEQWSSIRSICKMAERNGAVVFNDLDGVAYYLATKKDHRISPVSTEF